MEPTALRGIIAGARAGNADAYRQLMELYGQRLFGYFLRATGSHHDAEDLLSELMLRLVRMLREYDDRGRLEPWLFSIAANLVRDRIRRRRTRRPAVSLEAESADGASLGESIDDPDEPPVSQDIESLERNEALMAALSRLDERSRQMVLLRHFGRMSFKEIAQTFECPVGTVLAKVHRALKSLREIMDEQL